MAAFLSRWRESVAEYWEPGAVGAFAEYDQAIRALPALGVHHTQPTAGTRRFMRGVDVLVMSPAARARRPAAVAIDAADAISITLRLDFHGYDWDRPASFVLGSGSMLTDWDNVEHLFGAGPTGSDELDALVFKIPHHPTRGLGLNVMDAIGPSLILVSARPHDPQPKEADELMPLGHAVDAVDRSLAGGGREVADWELGIHDTSATDTNGQPLGSIALVVAPTGRKRDLWRFRDGPDEIVDLTRGARFR
jgi:hypothetical protein